MGQENTRRTRHRGGAQRTPCGQPGLRPQRGQNGQRRDAAHDEGTIADWARCDGTAASPDLRGKFIKGASSNGSNVNGTGGAAGHTNHNAASHSHNSSHSHFFTKKRSKIQSKLMITKI